MAQNSSLASAGGNLDLLDAIRGQGRRKSQAEMLRDQSLSPVDVGSYNGIQSSFPVSQGFNKIAQGLLADWMDKKERDTAQGNSDLQTSEAKKFADGLIGTPAVAAQPGVDAQPGSLPADGGTETPDAAQTRFALSRALMGGQGPLPAPEPGQRMEALPGMGAPDDPGVMGRDAVAAQASTVPTPAQRTAMLLQAQFSNNPGVNRVAQHVSDQDAIAEQKKAILDQRQNDNDQRSADRASAAGIAAGNNATQRQLALDSRNFQLGLSPDQRKESTDFANAMEAAKTPEERANLMIRAQLSGNPNLQLAVKHITEQQGKATAAADKSQTKAMEVPPRVLDQYNANLNAYKTTGRTVDQIDQSLGRLADGSLKFDILNNTTDSARNMVGATSEQSRNKAEYQNDIMRIANDVLLQAKGTQTEGDARRALTLIQGNMNDPAIVKTQLEKMRRIAADTQNTAATTLNISGKAHPGLDHAPVSMARALPEKTPSEKPAPPSGTGPGTQNSPIHVTSVEDAMRLPPGTYIRRPNGSVGQVPPR